MTDRKHIDRLDEDIEKIEKMSIWWGSEVALMETSETDPKMDGRYRLARSAVIAINNCLLFLKREAEEHKLVYADWYEEEQEGT